VPPAPPPAPPRRDPGGGEEAHPDRTRSLRRRLKVVSDIDDTLHSSGGAFPAGVDRRFPKGTLYPGMLSLLREVHAAVGSDGAGDLALLSARPHTYKDLTEQVSYAHFARLRRAGLLHATPTLLAGDLSTSLKVVTSPGAAFEAVARKKFERFVEYARLYPDYDFVFFGDNGQGDVRTAELMLEHATPRVLACLVHVVQPLEHTHGWASDGQLWEWEAQGMRFYHTAAGAARHLYDQGLLGRSGMRNVAEAAARELAALSGVPGGVGGSLGGSSGAGPCTAPMEPAAAMDQRRSNVNVLNADLTRCNDALGDRLAVGLLPAVPITPEVSADQRRRPSREGLSGEASQSASAPVVGPSAAAAGIPRCRSLHGTAGCGSTDQPPSSDGFGRCGATLSTTSSCEPLDVRS